MLWSGYELSNEPDLFPRHNFTVTASQLAHDFGDLNNLVNEIYTQKKSNGLPVLAGCDVASP